MRGRRLFTGVGVVAGLAGLALVFVPGLATGVGTERAFLFVVAAFAAVQAVLDLRARGRSAVEQATTPDVEMGVTLPIAGADLDEALRVAGTGVSRYTQEERERIRTHLAEVAVTVLSRRADQTPAEAEELLAGGTWTDDPYAAAFFGADVSGDVPVGVRIRNTLVRESSFSRQARHAIDELVARSER